MKMIHFENWIIFSSQCIRWGVVMLPPLLLVHRTLSLPLPHFNSPAPLSAPFLLVSNN